jgi:cytoskeletal protein CcmA (bactofilin family)
MFQKKPDQNEFQPQPNRPAQTPSRDSSANISAGPASAPTAPPPHPGAAPGVHGASTVLAEGCRFVGKAQVSGTFRVEGEAEGDLQAVESFVVGKSGSVQANVSTRRAILNGTFRGKIEATDRVEMQAGSNVQADVKARNMVMEDGVHFRGNCQIGS